MAFGDFAEGSVRPSDVAIFAEFTTLEDADVVETNFCLAGGVRLTNLVVGQMPIWCSASAFLIPSTTRWAGINYIVVQPRDFSFSESCVGLLLAV